MRIALAALMLLLPVPVFAQDCQPGAPVNIEDLALGRPVAGAVAKEFGMQFDDRAQKKVQHDGLAFEAAANEPVYSAISGTVVEASEKDGKIVVIVDAGNGISVAYGGLNEATVTTGGCARAGEPIGKMGAAAGDTMQQLYFQLLSSGTPLDPLPFIE